MAQDSAHCFRFVALLARLQEPVLRLFSSTAACRRAAWISLPTADSAFVSGAVQRRSVRRRRDDVDAYMFDTPQSPVYERKSRRGGAALRGALEDFAMRLVAPRLLGGRARVDLSRR